MGSDTTWGEILPWGLTWPLVVAALVAAFLDSMTFVVAFGLSAVAMTMMSLGESIRRAIKEKEQTS